MLNCSEYAPREFSPDKSNFVLCYGCDLKETVINPVDPKWETAQKVRGKLEADFLKLAYNYGVDDLCDPGSSGVGGIAHLLGHVKEDKIADDEWRIPLLQSVLSQEEPTTCHLLSLCSPGATLEHVSSAALHLACAVPNQAVLVPQLCSQGAKVNETNSKGQTPLHVLVQGSHQIQLSTAEEGIRSLLKHGALVTTLDHLGESPLLKLKNLLLHKAFGEAAKLAEVLLEANCDPNTTNSEGRCLLSYSVHFLDDAIELSRLLVNHGACIWQGSNPKNELDQSAFTWFLKGVIKSRSLENCDQTVNLLSQLMSDCPKRMYQHVFRTMFRHVKCYKVLGPVFLQLKQSMKPYWCQPNSLRGLTRQAIRKQMGHRSLIKKTNKLQLPTSLKQYILFER